VNLGPDFGVQCRDLWFLCWGWRGVGVGREVPTGGARLGERLNWGRGVAFELRLIRGQSRKGFAGVG
jgi:hypothetical protein